MTSSYKFETLAVSSPKKYVLHVQFNRVDKMNAMNGVMWKEMSDCFNMASNDESVRAIILSGKGQLFTSGLDLEAAGAALTPKPGQDAARRGFNNFKVVGVAQEATDAIERCVKPVIAAVHGDCIGGGVDTITACDIRLCSNDANFSIKEIDVAIAQDMGTLQRLPKIIGNDSLVRELSYTGRMMLSDEALSCGLVSKVCKDHDELMEKATELASLIASKSPVAVQSAKINLNYSRNHSITDGLQYIKAWNAMMLQTEDIGKSAGAMAENKTPADVEYADV